MRNMRFSNIFHYKPRLPNLLRQAHPLLRRGLGRFSPFFPLFLSTTIENGNFLTLCHPFHWNIPFNKWKTSLPPVLITSKPRLPILLRQAHPLLRRGLGRPHLFFFLFLSTTPNPTPPGTSPPSEGLGEAVLPPFLFLLWAWGGSPFIFQIFPSTPPLARKYWKYEHIIFRQNTPFLSFTAAADASVDQFITFYFLSSLSPNIFLLSFFRCLFLSISPDHYAFL